MFRNYLTYTLALSFHRSCCAIEAPAEIPHGLSHKQKERLLRTTETMIHHFAQAIHTHDRKEESRHLAVALLCLRDAEESFEQWGMSLTHELRLQFRTLHGRLEQLVLKASEEENGQLRMLG
jgi:hypothetical protein